MRTILFLSLTALPASALAQQTQPIVLDTVYLDAGLTPIEEQAYGRANSVITREELEASGVATVQDALRRVPGLAVSASGESNTQVRIRGAEGNHTLVLIDGIRAMAGAQEYFFSGIPSTNIERIEVLRGPQSVFFGADASAGVINIITDKGDTGTTARAGVEYGDGWSGYAHIRRRDDRGGVALSFSRRNDHGYDISDSSGGDDDGLRRSDVQLSADYALSDSIRAGLKLRRADQEYEYDAVSWTPTGPGDYLTDSNDRAERAERGGQLWLEADTLDGRLSHRLSYDQTRYEFDDFQWTQTEARTEILKYRAVYGLDGRVADADHTIAFGLERRKDENSLATNQRRRSDSAIVEYRGAFANGLDVQLGLRRDENDVFKDATTWSLGLSYQVPNAPLRLHASAGTGVVNPDYAELFGAYGYVGNPDLKPEENRSFDFGIEVPFLQGRGLVDVTYFDETLTGEIESYMVNATTFSYRNQAGDSDRKGVELAASLEASEYLDLRLSYTYLDATNPDGSVEIRRPEHELLLSATLDTFNGRGSVTTDIRHVAGNWDSQFFGSFATAELPDYTTVDVAAQYELTDNVVLTGRVTNLFDEDYADVWGYAKRGRAAYIGVRASF